MIILIKLVVAHFIGDFLLQPKSWVAEKEQLKAKSFKLYLYILIHGLLVLLVLWNFNYWLLALLVMVLHGIIDALKLYLQKESNKSNWFLIDQTLHGISILLLWGLFYKPKVNLNTIFEDTSIWIYSASILFITVVSSILTRELMSSWSRGLNDNNDESLSNAGKYIGMLERIFVFMCI